MEMPPPKQVTTGELGPRNNVPLCKAIIGAVIHANFKITYLFFVLIQLGGGAPAIPHCYV